MRRKGRDNAGISLYKNYAIRQKNTFDDKGKRWYTIGDIPIGKDEGYGRTA